uniref:Cytochrome P450 family 2 subfamily AR member 1 n=1 Tax=Sphenodon punctatus TaxID=8508 RepID=A0A8D0HFE6_SPHPU
KLGFESQVNTANKISILFLWGRKTTNHFSPMPSKFLEILHLWAFSDGHSVRKTYGPVFTIYLGSLRVVVLCGYETVKAALVDQADAFGGRAEHPLTERTSKGHGLFFSNGETWSQLRRFSLSTLRNFGMGKRSIEERIQEEAQCLLEEFRKTKGSPFDPTFFLRRSVSNIVCFVVFGERFDYDDAEFQTLLRLLNENSTPTACSLSGPQLYGLFPHLMKHLPGPHNKLFENFEEQKRYVAEMVQKHEATLEPASPKDYIDAFLIRMQQEKGNPRTIFHQENLLVSALDLFFAGTETISNSLKYGLLIFLKYPCVTRTMQEELDRVVGRDRVPSMEDRMRMPYTDAVIQEIQRFIDITPVGVPHSVTQDTHFRGFTIPKGTTVFPVLGSVLHDPTQFQEPENFDPGNFLDESGGFKKNVAFMPFSAGKRACPGEGLARMELFLFFTTLLQTFTLSSPANQELDVTPEYSGFGKVPRQYQLCLLPR